MNTSDFDQIPIGLYLLQMNHESCGLVLHIGLKTKNAPWQEQPNCPVYSEDVTKARCAEFWQWARLNLPIYEYPHTVKRAIA